MIAGCFSHLIRSEDEKASMNVCLPYGAEYVGKIQYFPANTCASGSAYQPGRTGFPDTPSCANDRDADVALSTSASNSRRSMRIRVSRGSGTVTDHSTGYAGNAKGHKRSGVPPTGTACQLPPCYATLTGTIIMTDQGSG